MNVFEGLVLEGFHLDVAENFISVPGLWTWADGRYRIQVDDNNKIPFAGDLSPQLNNFTQPTANRRLTHDGMWMKTLAVDAGNPAYLKSFRLEDFKFMQDGSPFGVYCITNFENNADSGANFNIVNAGGSGQTGFMFILAVSGVLQAIVRNGSTIVRVSNIGGLYTPGHANELTLPGTFVISHVFKGANVVNNQINRLGDLVNITTDTSLASEYSTDAAPRFFILHSSQSTKEIKTGLLLIYNWTGYTPTQIDAFDLRIRNLLNDVKPQFV